MRCFGITKKGQRCKHRTRFIFCHVHRIFFWIFVVALGVFAGLYQDLAKPIAGWIHGTFKHSDHAEEEAIAVAVDERDGHVEEAVPADSDLNADNEKPKVNHGPLSVDPSEVNKQRAGFDHRIYDVSLLFPSYMSGATILVNGKPAKIVRRTATTARLRVKEAGTYRFTLKKCNLMASLTQSIDRPDVTIAFDAFIDVDDE